MISWPPILAILHFTGLALGAGSATVKLVLLLKCARDPAFVPTYLQVARPITRLIILGMLLLTLSGVAWLLLGYAFTTRLVVKLALVLAIWVLGPVIDNVVEPRFRRSAIEGGASPAIAAELRQYLAWELLATGLFYVVLVLWVLR